MYSDLFEQLGGGAMGRAGGQPAPSAPAEKKPIVSLKAGKVTLVPNVERGTYSCTADPSRGEVRLACVNGSLEWQWYDRRQKKVVDRRVVPAAASGAAAAASSPGAGAAPGVASDDDATTTAPSRWHLERVTSLPRTHKDDRVYVLAHHTSPQDAYDLYWMQDADEGKEEETVAEFNQYLSDPADAVLQHGGGAGGPSSAGGAGASSSSARGAGASPSSQVDALSSILENLGMPQASSDSAPSSSAGANTLTLADLQGAMAGIQQQQQQHQRASAGAVMSLADVVTPDAITALLQDEAACGRLAELLPEGQRTREMLEENLRSPQVQQTLRALTAALLPDDAGHVDGFLSVVANFQLDAGGEGGAPSQETILAASTNPIRAFLDAILRSVEKDKAEDEGKSEE